METERIDRAIVLAFMILWHMVGAVALIPALPHFPPRPRSRSTADCRCVPGGPAPLNQKTSVRQRRLAARDMNCTAPPWPWHSAISARRSMPWASSASVQA